MILQALKDVMIETQLRKDLDNRLISYLADEAPSILHQMINKEQISYRDVRQADPYVC